MNAREQAEETLKPKTFRVSQRRRDLGGIDIETSAVDYWDAVKSLEEALASIESLSSQMAGLQARIEDTLGAVDFWLDCDDFRQDMALSEKERSEAIAIVAKQIRAALSPVTDNQAAVDG